MSHHQAQICTETMTNGVCRGDLRKFVGRAVHCSTRGIPGMLPKVEERNAGSDVAKVEEKGDEAQYLQNK